MGVSATEPTGRRVQGQSRVRLPLPWESSGPGQGVVSLLLTAHSSSGGQ